MHLFDRINRIQLAVWGGIALLVLLLGNPLFAVFPLAVLLVLPLIQHFSGRVARTMYDPTGRTVASKPAYSGPESLAVRGRFEEAIAAYRSAADDEPDDPEPWLRIARIERFDLKRPERALDALRAAQARAAPDSPTGILIARQLVEIHLRELGDPTRAMPHLARLAAASPDSPTGQWAARELADLKRQIRDQ